MVWVASSRPYPVDARAGEAPRGSSFAIVRQVRERRWRIGGLLWLIVAGPWLCATWAVAGDEIRTKDSRARAILDSQRVSEAQNGQNVKRLDRLYWEDHIQPYVGQTCALAACHGGQRAGRLHFGRPDINGRFTPAQSKFNFDMACWYVAAGQPEAKSRLVMKPLARQDGGIEHSGGNKMERGSYVYQRLLDWLGGARVGNVAPVAEAGSSFRSQIGTAAVLDGRASTDRNGDALEYEWTLVAVPEGSRAVLTDPHTSRPSLAPDREGDYLVELVVADGKLRSEPDRAVLSAFKLLGGMRLIEAETGRLESPMERREDATANAGFCVLSTEAGKGKASFDVLIEADGAYAVYARVLAASEESNSAQVQFGTGQPVTWHVPVSNDWQFEPCRAADGRTASFPLEAGRHTLVFRSRDANFRLDRVLITRADAERQLTPEARRFVKEVYLDLFQRGPSRAELLYAAGLDRRQLVQFLFDSYEYHERWYREQLYFMFLLRQFDPRGADWMRRIPALLHEGRTSQLKALQLLANSQQFHFRNLGPNNYTLAVFDHFLGRAPAAEENENSNRMYNGNPTTLLGTPGSKQHDISDIVAHSTEAVRYYVKRMHKRYFVDPIDPAELDAITDELLQAPEKAVEIQKRWLLSKRYFDQVVKLRPKSDIQYIRMLYVDVLNREPTQDEFDFVQNALQSFEDPIPLRSVFTKVLLDSKFVRIPPKPPADQRADWVRDQYLRFLSREPTPEELKVTVNGLNRSDATCKIIWQALLSSQEYQFY